MRILIDDVRRFVDGRDCVVWRTSTEAVAGLRQLRQPVDELWLDYDLGKHDDLCPVLAHLRDREPRLDVNRVHIITTNPVGGHAIRQLCDELGYQWERHYSLRGLLTAYPP